MAYEFRLPDIGEGLTEAEVVRWIVPEGDPVKVDQPVVEVETDKAVVEIPSPRAGTVIHHGAEAGQTLLVGEILLVIGEAGELWPPAETPMQPADERLAPLEEEVATDEGMPEPPDKTIRTSAPIVGTLSEATEDLVPRSGGTRTGRTVQALTRVQALPLVRRLAADLGIDLNQITGSGAGGRITREDVLAAAESAGGAALKAPPSPTLPPVPVDHQGERRPLSKLRRTIAANMIRSWSEIPHVTTFDEVDATRMLAARKALQNRYQIKVPLEALLIKALLPALSAYPEFNATLDGDDLIVKKHYDIGVAVDTPDGLLVAVVKTADRRTLLEVASEVRRLAEGARERKLAADELSGQTFTVSNIGALGGGFGTPIVPPGTTGILSVGRAIDKPSAVDGKVVVAPLMSLSLSYDHRVIDGGLGRRFMAMIIENLAEPALFLE